MLKRGDLVLARAWWVVFLAFLALLPASRAVGDWQITTYAGADQNACIAWNGNHYLIAWERDHGDSSSIYGRRVTSARAFAGDEFLIWDPVLSAAPSAKRYPQVSASGGGGSKWLVVWRNEYAGVMEILGQIIDSEGCLAGGVLTIGTTNYFSPVAYLAWNGSKWLVAWEGYETYRYIQGRLVYPDGSMGSVFDIDKETDIHKYRVRVGALGTDFFVAWMDRRDGQYNIYGKKVDTAGNPGSRLLVHACDGIDYTNTVSGGSSYFLVTWRCLGTGGNAHIWGQRVNAAGSATVGSTMEISSDQIYNSGGTAWTGSYFKVAYDLMSQGPYYRPVYEDGSMGSETDLSSLLSTGAGTYLATAQGDTNCLCAWEANIGNPDIYTDGTGQSSGIESDAAATSASRLLVCPNPLTQGHAAVRFRAAVKSRVSVNVYNTLGQPVAALIDEVLEAGEHSVEWDGQGLPAGVYFVRFLTQDSPPVTKKVVSLRQ